jgi:GDPmannose 4,6-dehydratase
MKKTAFITGITGQDGAYLAEFLLEKGYKVYGGFRRLSSPNFWRLEELKIKENINLIEVDLLDSGNLIRALTDTNPDEVYNLAAQSFVAVSFKNPVLTGQVTGMGVTNLLEAIRIVNPSIKMYQASSSEMFGKVANTPQNEVTPFCPRSPYAVAKLYGHWMTINYRDSYNIFACSGILFNHESPIRGLEFVTRKITDAIAKIKTNKMEFLEMGNLDAKRDWGYALDYVRAMWLMLQNGHPEDYIISTGESHSVREFIELAFQYAGYKIEWRGEGVNEIAYDCNNGKTLVKINPKYFRPNEVALLKGDSAKARKELGWKANMTFQELVKIMVQADIIRNES